MSELKPFAVLEGPMHEKLAGFRHVAIINPNLPPSHRFRTVTAVAVDGKSQFTATLLRGKWYQAGSWEADGDEQKPGEFPVMSAATRAEIFGDEQEEMKL